MVKDVFELYDTDNSGRIKRHLAHNILKLLGISVPINSLSSVVTLKDLLFFVDANLPEATVEGDVTTFNLLISQNQNGTAGDINPKSIIKFSKSIGVIPHSEQEVALYLTRLLDYDDCSEDAVVQPNVFQKDIVQAYKQAQALNNSTPTGSSVL
jgi:hypothetical protein